MNKRKQKTVEQVVHEGVYGKPARRTRAAKSSADVWFEKMLAEYAGDWGAKALASARAKMKG